MLTTRDHPRNQRLKSPSLRLEWQFYRDSKTKRQLNHKMSFIRSILTTHRQDKWNKFLSSLDFHDSSIYKINKNLLHKPSAIYPPNSPIGAGFSANDRSELYSDTI